MLYWVVNQICEEGCNDWAERPSEGKTLKDLKAPAAVLEVVPATDGGGHNH